MLEILVTVLFCWLFFKAAGLAFRMAWGLTEVSASRLLGLAVPFVVLGLVFAGGIALLLPVVMIAIALALLADCIA